MQILIPLLALLLGLVVMWLFMRSRIQHAQEIAKAESNTEIATLQERLSGKDQQIAGLNAVLLTREEQIASLQRESTQFASRVAELEATLENERILTKEKMKLLEAAEQKLSDAFKALSAEALKSNNQSFLELAKQNLEKFQEGAKGDLEKRQQAIDALVLPIKESLEKVDIKIQEIEKTRISAYSGLAEQLKSMASTQSQLQIETGNLVKALRQPTVRGRWGEIQLKRVVELAGMLEYCDFVQQESMNTEEGRLRPDMVVKLPGNKNIVVDSKVPLQAYLESLEAQDEETRVAKLRHHAQQVRTHMMQLGSKSYWDQFKQTSPEFVVLFIEGEVFFSAALEQDPELIVYGVERRVIIATPTTLISLLKAVSYGWRQEQIAENAQAISELGKELYQRILTLGEHFTGVGNHLEKAVDAYNKAVGSLETRVLSGARRFKELGVSAKSDIPELEPVDRTVRRIQTEQLMIPDHNEE